MDAVDDPGCSEEASSAMAGVGLGLAFGYQGLQILWPDAIGAAGAGPVHFKHLFLGLCFVNTELGEAPNCCQSLGICTLFLLPT